MLLMEVMKTEMDAVSIYMRCEQLVAELKQQRGSKSKILLKNCVWRCCECQQDKWTSDYVSSKKVNMWYEPDE